MRWEHTGKNLGSAVIEPSGKVIACKSGAWRIVYTAGVQGIATGGAVRICIPYGFTTPQTAYETGLGYATALVSDPDVTVEVHTRDPKTQASNADVWGLNLYIQVEQGTLAPGETITVHYGEGMSDGVFARYFDGGAEFTVAVDPDGARTARRGGFLLLDTPQPTLRVIGDVPSRLHVVIPSTIQPDESFSARVTVQDKDRNTVSSFDDTLFLTMPDGQEHTHRCKPDDQGTFVIPNLNFPSEGAFRVSIHDENRTVVGTSNPCRSVGSSSSDRVFWGDIHVMTVISAGLDRPADAYRYARDIAHLDFCATTDGDHADGYYYDEEWEENRQAVRNFYEPGRFVTLLASEYHERQIAGDKNIYYPDDDAALLRWSDLEGEQPVALWNALAGRKALTIPHHTSTGSRDMRPWDYHHPEYQRLVEVYSVWGSSECADCARPGFWRNNADNSVQQALSRGYRLGILASGDSHDGHPGNSEWLRLRRGYSSGLVAVSCPELTREAVFDALWNRRCYGTSGTRILLSFTLNDASMGEEVDRPEDRIMRRLHIEVAGTAPVRDVTVVRNSRDVYIYHGSGSNEAFEWVDEENFETVCLDAYDGTPFIYYYIRVVQEDGELAWSSPIWVS